MTKKKKTLRAGVRSVTRRHIPTAPTVVSYTLEELAFASAYDLWPTDNVTPVKENIDAFLRHADRVRASRAKAGIE
jgi:hypothetical protein